MCAAERSTAATSSPRKSRRNCCASCAASSPDMADLSEPKHGRRELSRRGLLGPDEGWSLAPVGAWIMIEGRHIANPQALLETLAARLNAAGASIDRLGFT